MRRKQQGFTLIELLVVMAIIAILASIVVPNIVGWIGRARMTRAQAEIESIELSLSKMLADAGRNSLNEFFDPARIRELISAPYVGEWDATQFQLAQEIYTRSLYALLREGRNALASGDGELAAKLPNGFGTYRDVLRADVVKNLSSNYVEIAFDPWGNLYQIFPAPWPRDTQDNPNPNVFRVFSRAQNQTSTLPGSAEAFSPDTLSGIVADDAELLPLQDEYQENIVGYPAPRNPAAAFIYSYGANMKSGQLMYRNAYDTPPRVNYDQQQEIEFMFGGDDINNWDPENSWSKFYN